MYNKETCVEVKMYLNRSHSLQSIFKAHNRCSRIIRDRRASHQTTSLKEIFASFPGEGHFCSSIYSILALCYFTILVDSPGSLGTYSCVGVSGELSLVEYAIDFTWPSS